jgi:hypothetical protein
VTPNEPNKWASTEKTKRLRLNLVRKCWSLWTRSCPSRTYRQTTTTNSPLYRQVPDQSKSPSLSLGYMASQHSVMRLLALSCKVTNEYWEIPLPPKKVQHLYAIAQQPLAGIDVNWHPILGGIARYVINRHYAQYEASLDPTGYVSSSEPYPCLDPVAYHPGDAPWFLAASRSAG